LYLDNGWFRGMTLNWISPQPSTQSARRRWQVWDFGQLHAGVRFTVFIAWQANATNPGRHAQDVALYDGSTQLMIVHRAQTVFPSPWISSCERSSFTRWSSLFTRALGRRELSTLQPFDLILLILMRSYDGRDGR
jgi:hypothetical protein